MLLWRRISAGFPVPKPLWTDVAWKYQNTGLGHAWICLWLHMPGEFNEVRTKYKRDPRCSLAPPLAYLLSCSFLFFPLLSFSLLFFPCLSFFFSPFSFSFLFFPLLCFSFLFLLSFSFLNFFWTLTFQQMQFYDCSCAREGKLERLSLQLCPFPTWLQHISSRCDFNKCV